jgi:Carboxypeptidase regulatory-like domain/TonB dependent receptor-like, beta-barrel
MLKFISLSKYAFLCLAVASLLFLTTGGRLWAQGQTATITGTATDASGAALVGAKVVATNTDTSVAQSAPTDAQGRYTIPQLPVGTYTVQASLSGFQSVVHSGVVLSIGGTAVVDFSLPVGNVSQTVNVEANVSQVQTTTASISALITHQQISDMPLNGRNFEQLITLAPGVVTVPASENLANFVVGRLYGAMDNYSISGSRPTGQAFLLDSTDIRDFWEHGTGSGYAGTSLGVEAIGQFQILTNTYDAKFAGNGVVINAVSRSGTNDFHGGAYEYFRNNHLDAAALSDKDASLLASGVGVSLASPPPFTRNQFGIAVGGPIKKDKLFFFSNYEGLRENLTTSFAPVYMPMGYVMNGELPCSQMALGSSQCPGGPYTGTPGSASNPLVAVAPYTTSDDGLAAANLTRMTNIMKLYSLCTTCVTHSAPPTGSPLDQGGYYVTSEAPALISNEDYAMGRVDYNLSSKDSIFGRYTFDNAHVVDGPRSGTGIFPEDDYTRNQFLTIMDKHIVSPTTINSLHFGYTRVKEASYSASYLTSAQLSKVGLASDPLDFNSASGYADASVRPDGDIAASVNAIAGVGFPDLGPDADRPDSIVQSKFSVGDDLVWTHGAHTFELGGVVQRIQTNNFQLAYASGQDYISTTDVITNSNNFPSLGGLGSFGYLEPFLQGTVNWGYFVPPGDSNSIRYFREIGLAPYFQDSWQVSRKLTLILGIRYDYFTNPVGWAGGGQSLHTVVGSFLPPIGPLAAAPNCSGIPTTTSTVGLANCLLGIFTPVKHVFASNINAENWAPRFGFAYSPFSDNKTAIRGGFGIFHDPVAARIYESGFIGTAPAASVQIDNLFGTFPASENPCLPDPFAIDPGYCGFPSPAPGEFAAVDYRAPNGSPYEMQFNLNVQREIASGTVLSIAYVGSLGRHMWMQRDENPLKCATFPDCSAIPTAAAPNTGACFSIACGDTNATTINPDYGSRVVEATTSSSSYHSLQVTLNRQFAKNISGQVNYTWSHCIDDGSFATSLEEWGQLMTDPYNQSYDYGNCNFDVRHNLSANALYTLPFKGNRLVEGWQFATIVSFNSGMPLNVANTTFPFGDPSGLTEQWGTRPNYSMAAGCSPNRLIKQWNVDPASHYITYDWYDPTCYAPQSTGYMGNVVRNSLQGPHIFNEDFSIIKNTKITEKLNAQFRAEFFNILNHFNPAAPVQVLGTAGNVPTGFTGGNATQPRQIQFALKLDF